MPVVPFIAGVLPLAHPQEVESASMTRIALPQHGEMSAEQLRVYDIVKRRSRDDRVGAPYQLALHCPAFLEHWQRVGEELRYKTSLPARLSELAILITARHWTCQYEWYAHEPHARRAGLADDVIEAVRRGERPAFAAEDEAAIYDFCTQLHETRSLGEAAHGRVLALFGAAGVVELTALIGHYAMVAMMLNANAYGPPAGVDPPLPAIGQGNGECA